MFVSIQEFAFVRAHRRECRSVHLSKQTEFDCGGVAPPARGRTLNPDKLSADCLSASKWERTDREWKEHSTEDAGKTVPRVEDVYSFVSLDSAFERYRQYSTLKMSICSDRRVIFSRSAPLRNVYEFVKRCTYISLNDFGETASNAKIGFPRNIERERRFLIYK